MGSLSGEKSVIEQNAEDLFNYAVDREDVKALMANLHEAADVNRDTVEYELQILKIISVGWAISYHLENSPARDLLGECYWRAIREFSQNLSETFGLVIGGTMDYFSILKERLATYLDALGRYPDAVEPAAVMGPAFAEACGNRDDAFTVMTGARMFIAVNSGVKQYLAGSTVQ